MNSLTPTPNKVRVLVVEDEAIVARDICQLLSQQGYEPVADTPRGEEAIELVAKLRPDLILMDINLAGTMDGITAARLIRERFALPVIFLTAFFGEETLERAKEAEPFGYIIKPFDEQDLRAVIEMALFKNRAELRVRLSETRHNKMVANISDVIAIIDQDGIDRYKSPNLERLFGWKPEEVVGSSSYLRVHPEDVDTTRKFMTALLETPNATGTTEYRFRCKDGSYRWVEFMGVNLLHDPDIRGLLGDCRDITSRRQSDARLRLLSHALDAAANAIFITNREGIIEWANTAFTTITGYTTAEAVGHKPGQLLSSGKQDQAFFQGMWATILAGKVWHGELINRRKDGHLYSEEMTITPLPDEHGDIAQFIAVNHDITQRKVLEEQFRQAQKMEAIGQLAGGVAHDFNNILAAVMMHLGLLEYEPSLDPSTRSSLKELGKEIQRGATLTRQLLAFSRQQAMELKRLDLHTVVAGLLKMLRRLLGENIMIDLQGEPGAGLIEADAGMIEQVVINLCINARDAMPDGGSLTLQVDQINLSSIDTAPLAGSRPGRFLRLSITDTGEGMSNETLQHIFEPFFTTKEIGKGTGLGLATVYGIVHQHKGWINVVSALGQGTTIHVYLPMSESPTDASPEEAESRLPARGRGETILLVEDETSLRATMAIALRHHGYNVIEAPDGPTAVRLWQRPSARIDLLLTDIIMPGGMNGQDLVNRLRAERPELNVIAITGYSKQLAAVQFSPDARVALLRKPFGHADLLATVRASLVQT